MVIGVRRVECRKGRDNNIAYLSNFDLMRPFTAIPLLFAVLVAAHGDHDNAGENPNIAAADYAVRHVRSPIPGAHHGLDHIF